MNNQAKILIQNLIPMPNLCQSDVTGVVSLVIVLMSIHRDLNHLVTLENTRKILALRV